MWTKVVIAMFVGMALTLTPQQSQATPITFGFSGTITNINDRHGLLDGSITKGTPLSGTYTFESTMTDNLPSDLVRGLYTTPAPLTSVMIATLGNYVFTGPSTEVFVEDLGKDLIQLTSRDFQSCGFHIDSMMVAMFDTDGTAFSGDSLPLIPPTLGDFASVTLLLQGTIPSGESFNLSGDITVLVPEPASLLIIAMTLLTVCNRRRG